MPKQYERQSYSITAEQDEIVFELPTRKALSFFAMLVQMKLDVVLATNYFLLQDTCKIWMKDPGFRVKNLFLSGMLATDISMLHNSKDACKGTYQLFSPPNLTTYQFQEWIQTLQKENVEIISHSPLSHTKRWICF